MSHELADVCEKLKTPYKSAYARLAHIVHTRNIYPIFQAPALHSDSNLGNILVLKEPELLAVPENDDSCDDLRSRSQMSSISLMSLSSPAHSVSPQRPSEAQRAPRPSSPTLKDEERYEFRFNDNGMDADSVTQSLSLETVKTVFGIVHSPILDGTLHMEKVERDATETATGDKSENAAAEEGSGWNEGNVMWQLTSQSNDHVKLMEQLQLVFMQSLRETLTDTYHKADMPTGWHILNLVGRSRGDIKKKGVLDLKELELFAREVELYAIMQRVSDSGYLLEAGKSLDRAIACGNVEAVKSLVERMVVNLEIYRDSRNQEFLERLERTTSPVIVNT